MASVSSHSTCAQPLRWTRSWALSAGAEVRLVASQSQPTGPIAAAARRHGALAERRCSVAWALRRWTGKGEQDDLGRTHEVIAQVARQALRHEGRAPLRAPKMVFQVEQLPIASHSWPSSFFFNLRRRVTVHGLLLVQVVSTGSPCEERSRLREERVCWENGGGGVHPFSTQTLNLGAWAPRQARSLDKKKVHGHQDETLGARTSARRDASQEASVCNPKKYSSPSTPPHDQKNIFFSDPSELKTVLSPQEKMPRSNPLHLSLA